MLTYKFASIIPTFLQKQLFDNTDLKNHDPNGQAYLKFQYLALYKISFN